MRRLGEVPARISLPHEHLVNLAPSFFAISNAMSRFLLVIEELAAAIIRVHRDQHAAFGIDGAIRESPCR